MPGVEGKPNIDRDRLLYMMRVFPSAHWRDVAQTVGVTVPEPLPKGTRAERQAIILDAAEARGRLPAFAEKVASTYFEYSKSRQAAATQTDSAAKVQVSASELVQIKNELANVHNLLNEVQTSANGKKIDSQLQKKVESASLAVQEKVDELSARVILPRKEDMDVPLVPSHLLDRLEEYHSDEKVIYSLIGLFGGAMLGILGNWATNESFTVTRFSVVLLVFLAILTLACGLAAWSINRRAVAARHRMLPSSMDAIPVDDA